LLPSDLARFVAVWHSTVRKKRPDQSLCLVRLKTAVDGRDLHPLAQFRQPVGFLSSVPPHRIQFWTAISDRVASDTDTDISSARQFF